jgi:hypothetical protein
MVRYEVSINCITEMYRILQKYFMIYRKKYGKKKCPLGKLLL